LKQGHEGERAGRPVVARWLGYALLACSFLLTGCVTPYVDGTVKEVLAEKYRKPSVLKPAQLIFEFQTKGALNTRATDHLKAQVAEQVRTSGLFSNVAETPAPNSGLLSISLNNVPVTDDAFSKGFVAGFTFGLVGSTVTDGYVCTVKYFPAGQAEPIVKSMRHAIHTSVGATSGPVNATKMDNLEAAVRAMTRQIVSNGLNELSQDPSFK
jgi:hypothetical protein